MSKNMIDAIELVPQPKFGDNCTKKRSAHLCMSKNMIDAIELVPQPKFGDNFTKKSKHI